MAVFSSLRAIWRRNQGGRISGPRRSSSRSCNNSKVIIILNNVLGNRLPQRPHKVDAPEIEAEPLLPPPVEGRKVELAANEFPEIEM